MPTKLLHPLRENPCLVSELNEFYDAKGYYRILSKEDEGRLEHFLQSFASFQSHSPMAIPAAEIYDGLPFSMHTALWKERQSDVKLLRKFVDRGKKLKILDVGATNLWLSNYLTKLGHEVVAVDIFSDSQNGLSAYKMYNTHFLCLQMLPHEIDRIKEQFDLIVFNRCWPYVFQRVETLKNAKQMLNEKGALVLTGLPVLKDAGRILAFRKSLDDLFLKKYGVSLFFYPQKGFLEYNDLEELKSLGFQMKANYPYQWFYKYLFRKRTRLFSGVYLK
ncbi:class I SAM-dependent methyltransferase [Marinilongibacter aquaticus]|uniref:class I SAM-dependent methyltransferase n=1 Tax=Marinilongibacter aquaticus TaxID=2975157 RepID=UPI0021BD809D|nr:class I SAM-dependent methyltransferase [Marinilongibacter aquaticus]UBM59299.1 class I SAM-dependent methyltransferase [Marinilongibacter aquaticus]